MTGHEFYELTNGKSYDIDGYYGPQCWDLFAYFTDIMGYPRINCTDTGYVIDIWNQRNNNGLTDYFIIKDINNISDGDWVVFDFGNISHIAMFRTVTTYDDSTAIFLGQNQGNTFVDQQVYNSDYIVGVFRAKDMIEEQKQLNFKARVIVPVLNIRDSPSINANIVNKWYQDEEFFFQKRIVADGYTWAEYTSFSGNLRYCAIGELYGEQYIQEL